MLRLVSEGKLTAEEAAPIIEALGRSGASRRSDPASLPGTGGGFPFKGAGRGRRVRIQVTERGRRVVDVRVPLAFAAMAARMVPGIPDNYAALIEHAVESDLVGPLVETEDEDGDAVLISVE